MSDKSKLQTIKTELRTQFRGQNAEMVLDEWAKEKLKGTLLALHHLAAYCEYPKVQLEAIALELAYFLGRPVERSINITSAQPANNAHLIEHFSPNALAALRVVKDETERLLNQNNDAPLTRPGVGGGDADKEGEDEK